MTPMLANLLCILIGGVGGGACLLAAKKCTGRAGRVIWLAAGVLLALIALAALAMRLMGQVPALLGAPGDM